LGESTRLDTPRLSIVIVNSDGERDTLACLESIYCYPPEAEFEVVLVDNCSQDSCLSSVKRQYPQVRTFSAPERQGFAKNYNLGMHHARGEYVLILNNDTVVHKGAIGALFSYISGHPAYDMVGGKLLSSDGRIQPDCARSFPTLLSYVLEQLVLDPGLPLGRLWHSYVSWRLSQRSSGPVPCISGACMLTTREILQTVGPLNESYQLYFEDIEWCHRLQRHNKTVAYVAEALITHYGDRSISRVRMWAKKCEYQSVRRYLEQYHALTPAQMWFLWGAAVVNYSLRALVFLVLERLFGKPGHAEAYVQLTRWILDQRPGQAGGSQAKRPVTGDLIPEASASSGSGAKPEYR
jgi:GT2 family glycosyltransferase